MEAFPEKKTVKQSKRVQFENEKSLDLNLDEEATPEEQHFDITGEKGCLTVKTPDQGSNILTPSGISLCSSTYITREDTHTYDSAAL